MGVINGFIKEAKLSRCVWFFLNCKNIIEAYSFQVSDALKQNVPDDIREKAREMARQELQRRLEELDMSHSEAKGYAILLSATQAHMASLLDLLERED